MPELKERGVAVHVNNDAVAALAAGTAGVLAGAAVLIAGTGTIALGYGLDDPDAGEPQRSRALEDDQHAAQERERLPKQAQVERASQKITAHARANGAVTPPPPADKEASVKTEPEPVD